MSVQSQSPFTFITLFIRTLMPSSASIIATSVLALAMSGAHMLLITINGDVSPGALNGQALDIYNAKIVDPLLHVTNNTTVNNWLGVVMWGVFGWILYELASLLITGVGDYRTAKNEVRIAAGTIVSSPMQRTLLVRFAWHLAIAICLSAFTIAMLPVMHYCLTNDYRSLEALTFSDSWPFFVRTVGTWILVLHGYLILLRLYVMRTRVFGEIIY